MSNKLHVKKDDTVLILSGDDKGKQGKVLGTVPSEAKVLVEGVNMVTCHVKARKQGQESAIVKREAPLYASKVQVICPSCKKATRIGHKKVTNDAGKSRSVRICKECGEEI